MSSSTVITCCCCKVTVHLGHHSLWPVMPTDWVSIDRRPFCGNCVKEFTEEDWDWLTQKPIPLGLTEVPKVIPGDIEPL
jgi:hypothetical protein